MNDDERTEVFDQWIATHQGLLFKVVRAFASSPHDREDLFQQIAIQLWLSIPSYNGSVAITTWMYRVAFYAANGWSRKENLRRTRTSLLGEQDALLIQSSDPENGRLEALLEQIRTLEDIDRSLALMVLDGCSYREMSDVLGLSRSNVGVRINRIKKRLTRVLNPTHGE